MTEEQKSGVNPLLIGAVIVIIAAFGFWLFQPQALQQDTVVLESAPATPAPVQELAPEADPATTEVVEAAPDPAPEPVAETAPPPPAPPTFDTFRVDPDGSMVIAGRAEAGQVVDIILAGQAIERTTADASGSFVAFPLAGPSDQPRRLSLLADPDGLAIASDTSYIVAPIAPPVVIAVAPEPEAIEVPEVASTEEIAPAEETADIDDVLGTLDAVDVAEAVPAPAPIAAAPVPALPQTPTVLEADADGVRVVQGGGGDPDNIALDAITYDPSGEVQLSGRAVGDGAVQIYIDNESVVTSEVTQGGDWQIELPQLETGVYTLRIDEVDGEGDVVSRIETPFKREEPADVAAVLAEETAQEGFEVAVRTVQPGATLWAIAEENLGAGILYVEVFEANSDLIRDPDLIYPGQIFRIPDISE
ncbi:MAG: LysM peptidoglycan-binding domain-containing protein [Yoonia sp.]|uniref:LysM peptidoglycan-binding domain-containing protein n=1 Tax=Yoonia sp. TaxID=2212373 RepID=UPI003EF4936B